MKVVCNCGERMYYTGENQPTLEPQRVYACSNKHVTKVLHDPIPDWGNYEVNRLWREAMRDPKKFNEYGDMP